jgi:molybdopterin-guanine dinucleotide biosynthesis protein A
MIPDMAGVVLAGGESRRFGANKALVRWENGTLIEAVTRTLTLLFHHTFVLVKTPDTFAFLERPGVRVVRDFSTDVHPLGGLLSALSISPMEHVFVCACDMPFIRPELVAALCRERKGYDAVVPRWQGFLQPLCGVYARTCLDVVGRRIEGGELSLQNLFQLLTTRIFNENEVRSVDPEGLSFIDIDTQSDYEKARNRRQLK